MSQRAPFFVLLLLLSLPALAQLPRNDFSGSTGWADLGAASSSQVTGASYNRYWNDMVSTRVGGLAATKSGFTAVYASMEVHVLRHRLVSPWAGLGIAVPRIADSEFSPIIGGGIDVRLTRSWAVGGEVRYMEHTVDKGSRFEYRVNPVTTMLAVRWRY